MIEIYICIYKEIGNLKLEKIKKKLEELNIKVYYGSAEKSSKDLKEYIVFGRDKIKLNDSKMSTTDYYDVVIVVEGRIAEGFVDEVIEALSEIGIKKSKEDIDFKYLVRNDISYEIASVKFFDTVGRTRWR